MALVRSTAFILAIELPLTVSGRGTPGCSEDLITVSGVYGIQGAYMGETGHVSLLSNLEHVRKGFRTKEFTVTGWDRVSVGLAIDYLRGDQLGRDPHPKSCFRAFLNEV